MNKQEKTIKNIKEQIANLLHKKPIKEKIELINNLREYIHSLSPFKNEPVDFVKWVPGENVVANEYNPNRVAPPEMELLEISIINDGYTQPIVTFPKNGEIEVVDGFHRNRVGKESAIVKDRIMGYLPITAIRKTQTDKNNRIASTIRHNRARGKHIIDAMSEIVIELKNRNWKNERIARELGMDQDEILRLCQITGLGELFKDDDFSRAWLIEDSEPDFEQITDEIEDREQYGRTVNTNDPERIFHTYDKWECYKAGFYNSTADGLTDKQCEYQYFDLLTNEKEFREALERVISEWKYSCEHYLTNKSMNRIAWLGQAALCISRGIPAKFRGGFNQLNLVQQNKANEIALEYLNKWLVAHNMESVDLETGLSEGRQVDIY